MGLLKALLYGLLALVVLVLIGAQFGGLSGHRPSDLGVTQGRLKPPSLTRNSVSSQADLYPDHPQRTHALLAPLPLRHGDAMTSLRTLATVLQTQPGITLVDDRTTSTHRPRRAGSSSWTTSSSGSTRRGA